MVAKLKKLGGLRGRKIVRNTWGLRVKQERSSNDCLAFSFEIRNALGNQN